MTLNECDKTKYYIRSFWKGVDNYIYFNGDAGCWSYSGTGAGPYKAGDKPCGPAVLSATDLEECDIHAQLLHEPEEAPYVEPDQEFYYVACVFNANSTTYYTYKCPTNLKVTVGTKVVVSRVTNPNDLSVCTVAAVGLEEGPEKTAWVVDKIKDHRKF